MQAASLVFKAGVIMDEAQIKRLIEEYLGDLPPKKQELIMLSVQKELDMHMFSMLRELKDRYRIGSILDDDHAQANCLRQKLRNDWADKKDE